MSIHRFHLIDKGQDLIYIDVESDDGDMGEVVGVNDSSIYPTWCKSKAVDFRDNQVDDNFNCADPLDGFKVFRSIFVIDSIEQL